MDVFEKMVLAEQDTDKKFLDAASFFVSLKEPISKTAGKGQEVKDMPEEVANPGKTRLGAGREVRAIARQQAKDMVDKTQGASVPIKPARKSDLIARLNREGRKALSPTKVKEIKGVSNRRILPTKKVKTKAYKIKKAALTAGVMDLLQAYGKKGISTLKGTPVRGALDALRPNVTPPGLFQGLKAKLTPNRYTLYKINKARKAKGLSEFTDLSQAKEWHKSFEMAQRWISKLKGGAAGALDLAGGTGAIGSLAGKLTKGVSKGKDATDYSKFLLPAAAVGAGGLGFALASKASKPKQEPIPVRFQG
jgi:hypothetical protein